MWAIIIVVILIVVVIALFVAFRGGNNNTVILLTAEKVKDGTLLMWNSIIPNGEYMVEWKDEAGRGDSKRVRGHTALIPGPFCGAIIFEVSSLDKPDTIKGSKLVQYATKPEKPSNVRVSFA